MSRVGRIVAPGVPHHVTQRGNRRADVFVDDSDRHAYLRLLATACQRHGVALWAYCLMTNHVHVIAVPATERSLSLAFRDAHTAYALRFNSRYRLSGHLWQGRFKSCPLDEDHLWAAVRYVERNPVRAAMVPCASDHPWSSAAPHCGLGHDPLLDDRFPPPGVIDDWAAWLSDANDEVTDERLRTHTRVGRPCGAPPFIERLERQLGRRLRPKPAGRKPKSRAQTPQAGQRELLR